MFRKSEVVNGLKMRKDLLIAESELNRTRLIADLDTVMEWQRTLCSTAKTFGPVASLASVVINSFTKKSDSQSSSEQTTNWMKPLREGAGRVAGLWSRFKSREDSQDSPPRSNGK